MKRFQGLFSLADRTRLLESILAAAVSDCLPLIAL
jgi:hypothetical protein